jgi:hypothetical protein
MPTDSVPEFYTSAQVADKLQVRRATVLGYICSGHLRAINIARDPATLRPSWRIPAQAVDDFVQARLNRPQPIPRRGRPAKARFYS